jgi:NAD-specific glutamate dehydrogenase
VARAFGKLDLERRARLLGRLLGSVGPLALAVVGGGVFAKYLGNARWPEVPISFEDAARATSSQVHELVRYVEQSNPHLVDSLLTALLQDGVAMTALGASVAAITIKRLSSRRGRRQGLSTKE